MPMYIYIKPSTLIILAQRRGSLRLVNTFGPRDWTAGRLEIFLDSVWGTVCMVSPSGSFDLYEADLACSELGYLYAEVVVNVLSFGYAARQFRSGFR